MSISTSEDNNEIDLKRINRKLLLSKLYDIIEKLEKDILKGRVKDAANTNARTQQIRALAYLVTVYDTVSKNTEIQELQDEIEEIKRRLKHSNKRYQSTN